MTLSLSIISFCTQVPLVQHGADCYGGDPDYHHSQLALPKAIDSQNARLGEEDLHSEVATRAADARANSGHQAFHEKQKEQVSPTVRPSAAKSGRYDNVCTSTYEYVQYVLEYVQSVYCLNHAVNVYLRECTMHFSRRTVAHGLGLCPIGEEDDHELEEEEESSRSDKIQKQLKSHLNGLYSGLSKIMTSTCHINQKSMKQPFFVEKAIHNIMFIKHHMKRQDEFDAVRMLLKCSTIHGAAPYVSVHAHVPLFLFSGRSGLGNCRYGAGSTLPVGVWNHCLGWQPDDSLWLTIHL